MLHSVAPFASCDLGPLVSACQMLDRAVYVPATRYVGTGGGTGQTWFDVSIGSPLVQLIRDMEIHKNANEKKKFTTTQSTLGKLLGMPDLRITPVQERYELQLAYEAHDRRLDEFGSGIAQFLVVAMTLAVRKPSFVLIDEPELSLHPSLQLTFLDHLAAQASVGTLFATHSLALARLAAEHAWMVHRDKENDYSYVLPFGDPATPVELLRDLQYGAFASVGVRKVLLVEGPTEVDVIRQWLRILSKDNQILPIHLGGSNSINAKSHLYLEELKRFNIPLAALIDSEKHLGANSKECKARQKFKSNCENLGIKCHISVRSATENYLTQRALDEYFGSAKHSALGQDDAPNATWSKCANWQVARLMTLGELTASDHDVGKFLQSL